MHLRPTRLRSSSLVAPLAAVVVAVIALPSWSADGSPAGSAAGSAAGSRTGSFAGDPPSPTPAQDAERAPAEPAAQAGRSEITLLGWTATRASGSRDDPADAVAIGRLLHARVSVRCERARLDATLAAFAELLGVNLATRYGPLLERDAEIDLVLTDVDGVAALEAIIGQATGSSAGAPTWQIHRGILEVGPREFLARSNAKRVQVYEIADLVHDVPSSAPNAITASRFGLSMHGRHSQVDDRQTPIEMAATLMQTIASQVEPEAWDPRPTRPDGAAPEPGDQTPRAPRMPPSDRNATAALDRNFDPTMGPIFVRGRWAQMDFIRQGQHLLIAAPDFVHRGIGGYDLILPPVVGAE